MSANTDLPLPTPPAPALPPRDTAPPTPPGTACFLAIEYDPAARAARYATVEAPDQATATRRARSAAESAGRIFIDTVTPAFLRAWLDRAETKPAGEPPVVPLHPNRAA